MYLKKIKLAGFKSFVDPTTIQLQSNLTGVVGPNGCGKSNIIDAVRWVMGEISAKQLRGESMTDVIFNGSSARKPVGQASVELIFDNSDASLGGEYAQYGEIAIRREVDRDSASDYFLNNARCRRKDITDVFLGTGLGPRSYAIIEQGMISELIEAKPDELRVLIEEAAGISKYKERRRETENRIKHTKENLARLNDIREELEKQLKHLKSQANAANRYTKLKQEERLAKAELHALHWNALTAKIKELDELIHAEEINLENKITAVHTCEAKISEQREQQQTFNTEFNHVQEQYYRIGANIARLEQQIQHNKERKEQLARDLAEIKQNWQATIQHQTTDNVQLEQLTTEQIKLEDEIIIATHAAEQANNELDSAEQAMQLWQHKWDEFNANFAANIQELGVAQTKISHLEQSIRKETQSIENLNIELQGIDVNTINSDLALATEKFSIAKAKHDAIHESLEEKQSQISLARENNSSLAILLDETRGKLQAQLGRKASLEALQQTALGKNDATVVDWLTKNNLQENSRLAQNLTVESGWETAVETVLGSYLEAVCLEDLGIALNTIQDLTQSNLVLLSKEAQATTSNIHTKATTLLSKISSTWPLNNLLNGIYVAESVVQALALRAELTAEESIITSNGIWIGPSWVRVAFDKNQKSGVIQRERELQQLTQTISATKELCLQQETKLNNERTQLAQLENEYQSLQQTLRSLTAEYSEIQGQISAKETSFAHLNERQKTLIQEVATHTEWLQAAKDELVTATATYEDANNKKLIAEELKDNLQQEKDDANQKLATTRMVAAKKREQVDNITTRLKIIQTQLLNLQQNLERAASRINNLQERQANLENSLNEANAPIAVIEQELQDELQQRLIISEKLNLAKQNVAEVENNIREMEKSRHEVQETVEQLRTTLEKLRTERQGLQVRAATYQEQITELEMQLDIILQQIPENASIDEWEHKINHLAARIERLGAINLAAIEEAEKLEERKNYLDAQNQDLVTALNTLETAIRKIDQDTKAMFKETYDNINQKFQDLFPKVFNGGNAYLELTSDDLLETGVLIMAQPPGKRNASIHLLSGGEKALTAISLIFSIFQLNPAPFCMLDEVDAPLDDLNVIRFSNLVKEMAKTIQFIFVTHNKITMEIAQQLAGITMQEPGVSRIVSVDIDSAIAMAQ